MRKLLFILVLFPVMAWGQILAPVMQKAPVAGGGSPAFVGGCANVATTGNVVSCTLSASATAGTKIAVVGVAYAAAAGETLAISDNCNTGGTSNSYSYTAESGEQAYNGSPVWQGYATVGATTASCTVTVTCTSSNCTWINIGAHNFSGATTLDGSAINPNDATTSITSSAITTTGASDYIFGWSWDSTAGGATFTQGTGFLNRYAAGDSGINLQTEDKIQSGAGSIAATSTASTTSQIYAGIMAFK